MVLVKVALLQIQDTLKVNQLTVALVCCIYCMNWITLSNLTQLNSIKEQSAVKPQIIFKHSTRCSISTMALNRLERSSILPNADFYYLDLLAYREISNKIAEEFSVYHESPQILLISKGACVYDESHSGISMEEIVYQINQLS